MVKPGILWHPSVHPFFSNFFSSICSHFSLVTLPSINPSVAALCPSPSASRPPLIHSLLLPPFCLSFKLHLPLRCLFFFSPLPLILLHTFLFSPSWQMCCAMASKLNTHTHILICTTKPRLQKQQHDTASRKHLLRTTTRQRLANPASPWQQATTSTLSFCLKKSVYMGTDAGLWTGGRLQGPELQPLRSEQPHRNVCAPDPFAPHQSITAAAAAAWRHAESHLLLLVTQVPSRPNVSDSWRGLRAEEVRGIQISSLSVNNSRGGREGWREGWRVEGGRRLRPRGSTRDAVSRDKVCETDARGIQRASLHSVIAILS